MKNMELSFQRGMERSNKVFCPWNFRSTVKWNGVERGRTALRKIAISDCVLLVIIVPPTKGRAWNDLSLVDRFQVAFLAVRSTSFPRGPHERETPPIVRLAHRVPKHEKSSRLSDAVDQRCHLWKTCPQQFCVFRKSFVAAPKRSKTHGVATFPSDVGHGWVGAGRDIVVTHTGMYCTNR